MCRAPISNSGFSLAYRYRRSLPCRDSRSACIECICQVKPGASRGAFDVCSRRTSASCSLQLETFWLDDTYRGSIINIYARSLGGFPLAFIYGKQTTERVKLKLESTYGDHAIEHNRKSVRRSIVAVETCTVPILKDLRERKARPRSSGRRARNETISVRC